MDVCRKPARILSVISVLSVVECMCISVCVIMLRLPAHSQPFVVPWFLILLQVLASILAGALGW